MALSEGKYTGEFLLSEANGTRSREEVVIAAAAGAMVPGTVVGKITASGKYVAYDEVRTDDGHRVAAGVLYHEVTDSAEDQKAVIIARDAEVNGDELTGSDANGIVDLKAVGIIVR